MIDKVNSKRPLVLMALLMLGMALMVVSANSAYATHDGGELPLTLPFTDGFGDPKDSNSNDVIHWDEYEDQDGDCAVKNAHGGEMALQLSNGCDAYVTFEMDTAATLFLEYDWGQWITSKTGEVGDLSVYITATWSDGTNAFVANEAMDFHLFEPNLKMKPADFNTRERVELRSYGLSSRPYTVEVHFVGTSEGRNDWAWVDNVNIRRGDNPFPEGTITHSQGYIHNEGEALACEVLLNMNRYSDDEMSVNAITGITEILASLSVGVDLSAENLTDVTTQNDVRTLCLFLVGDQGGQDACTFLPAGKLLDENERCHPKSNLAAQDITLRVNLNLDLVYGEWGVDNDVDFRPIEIGYYLNIDPVSDPFWGMVYPLDNYAGDEDLGACGLGTTEGLCSAGADAQMTRLGGLVQGLDRAGTTVGDMLAAADTLLLAGATVSTTHTVNTVELTQLQVTDILSMINKSYKNGIPTGFVTAWDYDPS